MKTTRMMWIAVLAIATLWIGAFEGVAGSQEASTGSPFGGPPDKLLHDPLWVILTTDVPGFKRPADLLSRHLAHQVQLEHEGVLFAAGPVQNDHGEHEYGMIIIRASSLADARRIADSDPMHIAGARTYTLHEWSLNEAHMTFSLDFSHSGVSFK